MDALPSALEVAGFAERIRREVLTRTPATNVHDFPGGWLSCNPATAGEEYPSVNRNRVVWVGAPTPVRAEQIRGAMEAIRAQRMKRAFFWLGPAAWDETTHAALESQGALQWTYAAYPSLVRRAGEIADNRATALTVRVIGSTEARDFLGRVGSWFSATAAALEMAENGMGEIHAAFDGETPAAISMLIVIGRFAYLGFAGTDPSKRCRGGQTSLIQSRTRRAAELGAAWCVSETNTAVMGSLRNLMRCGFREAFTSRVYRWEEAEASGPA